MLPEKKQALFAILSKIEDNNAGAVTSEEFLAAGSTLESFLRFSQLDERGVKAYGRRLRVMLRLDARRCAISDCGVELAGYERGFTCSTCSNHGMA